MYLYQFISYCVREKLSETQFKRIAKWNTIKTVITEDRRVRSANVMATELAYSYVQSGTLVSQ